MRKILFVTVAVSVGLAASAVHAQKQAFNAPRIGYIYPAGGPVNGTFNVTIGGQYLDGVTNVFISGNGVMATVVDVFKPITMKQAKDLRDKLQQLKKKENKDAATMKEVTELLKKLATFNRNANPTIAERVTVQVTIAADAEPGDRELRIGTANTISNPRVFSVGQLPEFFKKPAIEKIDLKNFKGFKTRNEQHASELEPDTAITIPAIVNGQIMPGRVDRFRFQAKKGQKLVIAASARELVPYIPDAVPGWFQATLALYDAKGAQLAYDDDYKFHPDPVLYYEIQRDGEYTLEIKDSIYRGREDFVYRVTIGEMPFITSIYPLGGKAGTTSTIQIKGWNLHANTLTQNKEKPPGVHPLSVRKDVFASNRVPFVVETTPEYNEQEPNDSPDAVQTVALPIVINGHIDKPGDWDVFRFKGVTGQEIVAEVQGRRLDSPIDSALKLTDATGKQIAFNDDHDDKGAGLNTHHADSYIRTKLPATGDYYLYLGDTQQKGGPDYAYRLRISAPQRDFELRVVPSSINVRGGTPVPVTVYALRKDGFTGEITLNLKDAPAGFSLGGNHVPANQDQVRVTLAAPAAPTKEPVNLHIEGRAIINGKEIVRAAIPAEDMMQAFAYRHLVPSKELKVCVSGKFMARSPVRILSALPLKIKAGSTARLAVSLPTTTFLGKLHFELSDPPDGLTIASSGPGREGTEIVLKSEAEKNKPGEKGNLIIGVFAGGSASTPTTTTKPKNAQRQIQIATLPAIPYEITAP